MCLLFGYYISKHPTPHPHPPSLLPKLVISYSPATGSVPHYRAICKQGVKRLTHASSKPANQFSNCCSCYVTDASDRLIWSDWQGRKRMSTLIQRRHDQFCSLGSWIHMAVASLGFEVTTPCWSGECCSDAPLWRSFFFFKWLHLSSTVSGLILSFNLCSVSHVPYVSAWVYLVSSHLPEKRTINGIIFFHPSIHPS